VDIVPTMYAAFYAHTHDYYSYLYRGQFLLPPPPPLRLYRSVLLCQNWKTAKHTRAWSIYVYADPHDTDNWNPEIVTVFGFRGIRYYVIYATTHPPDRAYYSSQRRKLNTPQRRLVAWRAENLYCERCALNAVGFFVAAASAMSPIMMSVSQ